MVALGFGGGFTSRTKIVFWCGTAGGLFALAGFLGFLTIAIAIAGAAGAGARFFAVGLAVGFFFAAVLVVVLPGVFFFARFATIAANVADASAAAADWKLH
jgi:hypothetical protein